VCRRGALSALNTNYASFGVASRGAKLRTALGGDHFDV
jgi:hypothetical protein